MTDVLAAATDMGAVTLRVAHLDPMLDYYTAGVGLRLLEERAGRAVLGRPGRAALVLEHAPELRHAPNGAAGLYHTAFLFDDHADLAAAVYRVARTHPNSFTGASDHLVSEALYFDDPERNGVELYVDRPRAEWNWDGAALRMGVEPLDANAFLRRHLTEAGAASGPSTAAAVGHVHLRVGDIPTARDFYVDTVGFAATATLGTHALFVSAGGYHHHVGMNTWQSRGAGPRTPALGLGQVVLRVPSRDDLDALRDRLRHRGVAVADDGSGLVFDDPWANRVLAQPA